MVLSLKKMLQIKLNLSYENNMTVSQVVEDIVSKMFSSIELNEEALIAYEEKYKKKSKKSKK